MRFSIIGSIFQCYEFSASYLACSPGSYKCFASCRAMPSKTSTSDERRTAKVASPVVLAHGLLRDSRVHFVFAVAKRRLGFQLRVGCSGFIRKFVALLVAFGRHFTRRHGAKTLESRLVRPALCSPRTVRLCYSQGFEHQRLGVDLGPFPERCSRPCFVNIRNCSRHRKKHFPLVNETRTLGYWALQ